jgi:hypothetical protein
MPGKTVESQMEQRTQFRILFAIMGVFLVVVGAVSYSPNLALSSDSNSIAFVIIATGVLFLAFVRVTRKVKPRL